MVKHTNIAVTRNLLRPGKLCVCYTIRLLVAVGYYCTVYLVNGAHGTLWGLSVVCIKVFILRSVAVAI